jgi:hypothetical protein
MATFQYLAQDGTSPHGDATPTMRHHSPGGSVELDERGQVVRVGSASDASIPDRRIYPYSVLPMPAIDRAVSPTPAMEDIDPQATSEWVQLWRLSDLTLLTSLALGPGPRGDEHHLTGEPLLLPDGHSVYIHTFNCGLYFAQRRGPSGAQRPLHPSV